MNMVSTHKYYLLRKNDSPIEWDIYDKTSKDEPELFWTQSDYCIRVLQILDKNWSFKSLVFYITFDELKELPTYGKNVVVMMVGGEGCQIPLYFHKVLAVFKPYGTTPFLGYNPLLQPSYISFLSLAQFFKTWIEYLPSLINFLYYRSVNGFGFKQNIFKIPLGYYKQLDLPVQSFESRTTDIFFAGSIETDSYPKGSLMCWVSKFISPPKTLSRRQMIANANKIKEKYPNLNVQIVLTSGFFATENTESSSYSHRLMDSKICLVPRGTSFETYRFFEAIRYGCIVIIEALPSRWYYDKSPAITIKQWSCLGQAVEELLANPEHLLKLHQETLLWWDAKCSPEATGQYIIDTLNTLLSE